MICKIVLLDLSIDWIKDDKTTTFRKLDFASVFTLNGDGGRRREKGYLMGPLVELASGLVWQAFCPLSPPLPSIFTWRWKKIELPKRSCFILCFRRRVKFKRTVVHVRPSFILPCPSHPWSFVAKPHLNRARGLTSQLVTSWCFTSHEEFFRTYW
jgi:hypothetical protein